jgi:hypothetical protein
MRPRALRIAVVIASAFVTLLSVARLGAVVLAFQTGADPADAFHEVPAVPPGYGASMRWLDDAPGIRPAPAPSTRSVLQTEYSRAWSLLNASSTGARVENLQDILAGSALLRARATFGAQRSPLPQVDLAHVLQLRDLSADGALAVLRDRATVARQLTDGTVVESQERYTVLLALQDGAWQIRNMRRETARNTLLPEFDEAPPSRLELGGATLRGVNYMPRGGEWGTMWMNLKPAQIARDLQLARRMGFSSIRVFVPYDPKLAKEDWIELRKSVTRFLRVTDRANMDVLLTLFDTWTDHRLEQWPTSDRYLRAMVRVARDHPSLLGYDLKNEADLDIHPPLGARGTYAWITHNANVVRRMDRTAPITVGWSSAQAAVDAAQLPLSFVTFHDYLPETNRSARFDAVVRAAHGRRVLLTEFGSTSYRGIRHPGVSEPEQARRIASTIADANRAGLDGTMVWTLFDPLTPPPGVRRPWNAARQTHYGVLRADGSAKPSAAVAAGQRTPLSGGGLSLPIFWISWSCLGLGGLLVSARARVIMRRRARARRHAAAARPRPEPPPGA